MSDPVELRPWHVPKDIPGRDQHPAQKLRFFLHWARQQRGVHVDRAEPRQRQVEDDALEVHADRTRALPVIDPHDRELVMSCAAALYNIRIAARHFGYEPLIEITPPKAPPDLLAVVRLGAQKPATAEEHTLFKAIPHRHTNRGRFDEKPLDENSLHVLERVSASEQAWIQIVREHRTKHEIAELIAEADRAQFHDKRFRRELAAWVHPNRHHTKDGMPGYSHGMGDIASTLGPFLIRNFDLGGSTAKKDHDRAELCRALVAIGTSGDGTPDWIHAGQALQHVLLHIASAGLSASFLNQPIQVEALRPNLARLIGAKGYVQSLLRIGHGEAVKPTPRRPVEDVIRVSGRCRLLPVRRALQMVLDQCARGFVARAGRATVTLVAGDQNGKVALRREPRHAEPERI